MSSCARVLTHISSANEGMFVSDKCMSCWNNCMQAMEKYSKFFMTLFFVAVGIACE